MSGPTARAVPLSAATFAVNSTRDATDALPGDGLCQTDITDECTLRAAIQEANFAAARSTSAPAISVPTGVYTLTLAGADENQAATGDLDLFGPLTITGEDESATNVDGGGLDRVFDVRGGDSTTPVNISNLTVRGGTTGNFGGGIFNVGNLSVTDVTVSGNAAHADANAPFFTRGGGIANEGIAALSRLTVSNNTADEGGGIFNGADGQD